MSHWAAALICLALIAGSKAYNVEQNGFTLTVDDAARARVSVGTAAFTASIKRSSDSSTLGDAFTVTAVPDSGDAKVVIHEITSPERCITVSILYFLSGNATPSITVHDASGAALATFAENVVVQPPRHSDGVSAGPLLAFVSVLLVSGAMLTTALSMLLRRLPAASSAALDRLRATPVQGMHMPDMRMGVSLEYTHQRAAGCAQNSLRTAELVRLALLLGLFIGVMHSQLDPSGARDVQQEMRRMMARCNGRQPLGGDDVWALQHTVAAQVFQQVRGAAAIPLEMQASVGLSNRVLGGVVTRRTRSEWAFCDDSHGQHTATVCRGGELATEDPEDPEDTLFLSKILTLQQAQDTIDRVRGAGWLSADTSKLTVMVLTYSPETALLASAECSLQADYAGRFRSALSGPRVTTAPVRVSGGLLGSAGSLATQAIYLLLVGSFTASVLSDVVTGLRERVFSLAVVVELSTVVAHLAFIGIFTHRSYLSVATPVTQATLSSLVSPIAGQDDTDAYHRILDLQDDLGAASNVAFVFTVLALLQVLANTFIFDGLQPRFLITLSLAFADLVATLVPMVVIYVVAGSFAHITFGTALIEFQTLELALQQVAAIPTGTFPFEAAVGVNVGAARMLYFGYLSAVFLFFVLSASCLSDAAAEAAQPSRGPAAPLGSLSCAKYSLRYGPQCFKRASEQLAALMQSPAAGSVTVDLLDTVDPTQLLANIAVLEEMVNPRLDNVPPLIADSTTLGVPARPLESHTEDQQRAVASPAPPENWSVQLVPPLPPPVHGTTVMPQSTSSISL